MFNDSTGAQEIAPIGIKAEVNYYVKGSLSASFCPLIGHDCTQRGK